jgi:hypothetical protein
MSKTLPLGMASCLGLAGALRANDPLDLQVAVVGQVASAGPVVAFSVRESSQGKHDRNGDGDTQDDVLAIYDARTGEVANLRLAVPAGYRLETDGSYVVCAVSEYGQGQADLDGDGHVFSAVLHIHDTASGVTTSGQRRARPATCLFRRTRERRAARPPRRSRARRLRPG